MLQIGVFCTAMQDGGINIRQRNEAGGSLRNPPALAAGGRPGDLSASYLAGLTTSPDTGSMRISISAPLRSKPSISQHPLLRLAFLTA